MIQDPEEIKALIFLNAIPFLTPLKLKRLIDYFGNAKEILKANIDDLTKVEGINLKIATDIKNNKMNVEKELELLQKESIKIITYKDSNYPENLKNLIDPPIILYVKGNFTEHDQISISIVGTRKPTSYGKLVVEHLIKGLANYNITVISGLAYGIDSLAHEHAIKNNLRTIAILGNGLGIYYPLINKKLQTKIPLHGALISEFNYKTPPSKTSFPQRNRIIAALSLATLIIEADIQSGALITANFALDLGKEVFAVPGSIFSNKSRGTNFLIKNGAKLVTSVEDIIEEIKSFKNLIKKNNKKILYKNNYKDNNKISDDSLKVLEIIKSEPQGIHIDKLQNLTNIEITKLMNIIIELELNYKIKELPGKIFISL